MAEKKKATKKTGAKKTTAKKSGTKKTAGKKAAAKKTPAKKSSVKKAPVKKEPAKKPAKKTTTRKPAAKKKKAPATVGDGSGRLRITQTRSPIGRPRDQKRTLEALGLRRIRQTVEHRDTPNIRGMVARVIHLVRVEEVR